MMANAKIQVGDIYESKGYGKVEVVERTDNFRSCHRLYKAKFLETGYIGSFTSQRIRNGKIKDATTRRKSKHEGKVKVNRKGEHYKVLEVKDDKARVKFGNGVEKTVNRQAVSNGCIAKPNMYVIENDKGERIFFTSQTETAKRLKVSRQSVNYLVNGLQKNLKGYRLILS